MAFEAEVAGQRGVIPLGHKASWDVLVAACKLVVSQMLDVVLDVEMHVVASKVSCAICGLLSVWF